MSAADPSKRVFMTIGDSSEFLKKPEKNAGTASGKSKTLRFDLDLFEPDEYKFPEYNYKKLVHIEKKKQKKISKLPNGNHADPFAGGEDGDVERITRELEEKYGSGSSYSKSSRLTTVDRGAGYDASDSFIDDTEAYDELIPEEIETDRGGFYINSGALEFKKLSNYERPGDEIRMPKAKKRALSSSSESSESDGAEEEKAPEKPKKSHVEKKVKTAATSSSDEQGKAKKSKKEKLEKLEKLEKPEKPKEVPKEVQQVKEPEKKKPAEKEPEKVCKTTTVKDMLRAKRDNMRKMEQGKPTSSGATTATDNDDEEGETESVSSLAVSESSRDSHPEIASANGVKDIPLPENLPAEIATLISSLKSYAETNVNAKANFFDNSTLNQLVKIDDGAKSVSSNVRIQTFNYLEQFVPCTKKTLFAKVRRHRVVQNELKVKNEVSKLRKIVADAMPTEIAKHDHELKKYDELMLIQSVVGDTSFEHTQPRKKFHWNDSSRTVLNDIILHLRDLYKITKSKKESEADYVARKLREEVVPLWPEGWIKVDDLSKEFERKKKKSRATNAAPSQSAPQVQVESNTASAAPASTTATNGKAPVQAQKTESNVRNNELDEPVVNGKASSPKGSVPVLSVSAASVIKRSSDHSISSIISTSPSPPTTSQSQKIHDPTKTRVIELDDLTGKKELLKVTQAKSLLPRFATSPIDITSPEKSAVDKVRRSDSSDSDCVEIVGEFNPIKPAKSVYNHNNNNKVNHSTSPHPAPVAKKIRTHGSDDGEHVTTDYSKIIMGIQSLTDPKKSNQFLVQNPLTSPVAQQQRKAETSHGSFELNGSSDHFLDPKQPSTKSFSHSNNLHYSIGDFIASSNRLSQDGNAVKGNIKSTDQYKPSLHYNHQQQQLTSSTNNNLHSISLSLTSPITQTPSHERQSSNGECYTMPSILNLSNKK